MKDYLMNDNVKQMIKKRSERLFTSVKWIVFAIVSGISVGLVGTLFYYGMKFVTDSRMAHPWLIFLLPAGGLLIVGMYKLLKDEHDTGTNLVLSAIHSGEEIPLRMAPLIFLSTLVTHLFGGSAGREGAALQLGGSIGGALGKLFRFNDKDQHIMIMCGMSAAFSALFGTPMAAAIFSMEIVSVGIMHYSALVPCVISALIAKGIAAYFGIAGDVFALKDIPAFSVISAVQIAVLAFLAAMVSILFCIALHHSEQLFRKFFKNPYLRAAAGGVIIILLTLAVGNTDYNGAGMNVIERFFAGDESPYAFLLKILFTAVTIGAGFKGGEIVPSFFIGAAFGSLYANILGLNPGLCAAVGMSSVFCGVTNCPITALLISLELFGYQGIPYFLLSVALSYMFSGYYGLYHSQKIIYSKYRTSYINRQTR